MITIRNTQRIIQPSLHTLKHHADAMKRALGYDNYDLGIWLATDRQIRALNSRYRNDRSVTDVLAFPNGKCVLESLPSNEMADLGDLVFGMGYIRYICEKEHRNIDQYLDRLIAHGICHLVGYDHMNIEETVAMREKEDSLLKHIE
jgi:probable rRNA maturation factor